jgi:hypothetical protein
MAQNRFLTAVETLWESVLTANGAAKTLVLKQRFNDILDFPVGVSIHAEMHPIQLYTHGPLREIRDRLRDAFRESIEDEDVRSIIDDLTVIDSSPQFLLMTSVISKFRQWRSSLEHSDSDSSSDSEED